ncbi:MULTISPECIES: hypothetical protein [unclassified Rhodanobacter]|uniref:hypothetical protein n=1 Tax=unclassified Rhodanobacter TaxID=2621553 RepID=UPI001BE10D87|nr:MULTISPECIES: hypothetical protein [unclassified Rhodanobacter]MBT2144754.1 hypothetical protein [Rhodanobacter sp. LX-99]MBT2148799.1 hypothetical protein [Rhodanobacter sp. LX-100]
MKWIAAIVASLVEHVAAGFACGACHLRKWQRSVALAAAQRSHRQCAQVRNMAWLFKKTGRNPLPDLSAWAADWARPARRDTCVEHGGQYIILRGIRPPFVGGF